MPFKTYDRNSALNYARQWAFSRNPSYLDFETLGGDCTNFASQCIYAGAGVMNYTKVFGWYYVTSSDRTASWTGVEYLFKFLITNTGIGPQASLTDEYGIEPGDIIQLGSSDGHFYHSPVVVAKNDGEIYVAAHTYDAYMRQLSSYYYDKIRYIHIDGVKTQ